MSDKEDRRLRGIHSTGELVQRRCREEDFAGQNDGGEDKSGEVVKTAEMTRRTQAE